MYYHIVKQEGLKYKNLDLKEVEEVVKKEKLNFNNSRIYSKYRSFRTYCRKI